MTTITPINRYTEQIIEDNGTKAYKVYNMMSPHYYMDNTGSLNPIDITNIQTITKDTVGEIKLREKNIASIGFRTDGNKTKYLGIRPDETQESGSQQFEWTIEEAIINNSTQSTTLNQTSSIDGVTTNLGGQIVQSTRQFTRQMVPVTGTINNFQIKYTLHLTGLQISNSKYTENTTVRNNISGSGTITAGTSHYIPDNGYFKIIDSSNNVKFMISLPVLLDSDFEPVTNDTVHTLKDNGDGTYEYIKYASDNLLSVGISDDVAYIDATTVYGDADLDGSTYVSSTSRDGAHDASIATSAGGTSTWVSIGRGYTSGGFFGSNSWRYYRCHMGFDTSDISATPDSAQLRAVTHDGYDDADIILIEGTHTEIATSTINDFTGYESGWDGDNAGGSGAGDGIIPYSAEFDPLTAGNYNNIPLLAAAVSAIVDNDTFKVCIMDHDKDFKDVYHSSPGDTVTRLRMTEYTDTDNDPYLYIVPVDASKTTVKIFNSQTKILGGKFIIK